MSEGKGVGVKPVQLPKVPIGKRPKSAQDAFWNEQGTSGALNAYRQLTGTKHKGGRKQVSLPGGKLQPLFKNYTAPPGTKNYRGKNVLPGISPPSSADSSAVNQRIICGHVDNLPVQKPSTVRVYLASNYEDMVLERGAIMEKAVPEIQDFCSQHGLHFQLVDLKWGLNFVGSDPTGSSRMRRYAEIDDCQRLSLGPNFIALLGDRYGELSVPREIPSDEFNLAISSVEDLDSDSTNLLLRCYKEDLNAQPPVYVLQESEVGGFEDELTKLILKAARTLHGNGSLTAEQLKRYSLSSLEEDIRRGILEVQNPRNHCLAYHREWRHLSKQLNISGVQNYIDTIHGSSDAAPVQLDTEKQNLNLELQKEVSSYLGPGNHRQYFISWEEEKDVSENEQFKEYIDKLCVDFIADVKHLITQGIQREKSLTGGKQDLFTEVLHHATLLKTKSKYAFGQDDVIDRVVTFIKQNPCQPFVIHGACGSGKTVAMSQLALHLRQTHEHCVVVFRSLGSSSASMNIHNAVISITEQICTAYGMQVCKENGSLFQSLTKLRSVLEEVSLNHASLCPLFILLDGLDKMQPKDESLKALWAIKNLPSNVFIIVSTVESEGDVKLLEAMLTLVTSEEDSAEVASLDSSQIDQVFAQFKEKNRRSLTDIQKESIVQAYHVQGVPLLIDLYLQRSSSWPSFKSDGLPSSADTIQTLLLSTLQHLEAKVGCNIVSFFAAYLTAVPSGVHERDLLDLLSCNPDVMQEVKSVHDVDDDTLFFPPCLLSVMKYGVRLFLTERFVHGRHLLAWRSRLCQEAVAEHYQVIFPGVSEAAITEDATSMTLMLHEHFADMYLGDPAKDCISEFSSSQGDMNMLMPQPTVALNQLKLMRLPVHLKVLLPLQGVGRICELLLFNFEWLLTKLQATSVRDLQADVMGVLHLQKQMDQQGIALKEIDDTLSDLYLLFEFLQLVEHVLQKDPKSLAVEVAARLSGLADRSVLLKTLSEGALSWVLASGEPCLLPICPCLPPPGTPLRHILRGPTHFVRTIGSGRNCVFFSQKNGTDIWHLESGELQQKFPVHPEQDVNNVIVGNAAEFVIIGHFSYVQQLMELSVWSSETGVRLLQSVFPNKFTAYTLNTSDNMLVVATAIERDDRLNYCLLGVDVHSKEIKFTLPTVDAHQDLVSKMFFFSCYESSERLLTLGSLQAKDLAVWDLDRREVLFRLQLPCFPNLLKEHAGKFLVAACSVEGTIMVVNLSSGQLIATITDKTLIYLRDIVITDDVILVATELSGVLKYSLSDGAVITPAILLPSSKPNVMMALADQFLFVGFDNGLVKLFDINTGVCLTDLEGHSSRVNTIHCAYNQWLITAADDECALIWNLSHLKESLESSKDGTDPQLSKVTQVSFTLMSRDGSTFYTALWEGDVQAWSVENGKWKQSLSIGDCTGVYDLYWAYKGKLLVGHGIEDENLNSRSLMIWQAESGDLLSFSTGPVSVFCSCVFLGQQDRILAISPVDGAAGGIVVSILDLFEMKSVATLNCNIFGQMNAQNLILKGFTNYTKSESAVLAASMSQQRGASREPTQKLITKMLKRSYAVLDYCPQPGVSFFFTFIIDGDDRDCISMVQHDPLHLDTLSADCTQVMNEGTVISGCMDGSLRTWDAASQSVVAFLHEGPQRKGRRVARPAHSGPVTCVAVTPDCTVLASGGMDDLIRVWTLTSKQLLQVLKGHADQISCVSISPDGQFVASASHDETVMLWSAADGKRLSRHFAHSSASKLHLLHDSQRIIIQLASSKLQLSVLRIMNSD